MRELAGKVAFITGGVSGIGLGIARTLLSAGMHVVVTYRREHHLNEAREVLRADAARVHAVRLDVTDREGMQRAADEAERVFGKVHVLCNNAGVGITTTVSEATLNDWEWAINVNLMGVVNGVQCFLPRMLAHGEGGHIVTTASMSGLAVPRGTAGVYAASKFAVVGMMEALRGELASRNIGVSVYCPGLVRTNLAETEDARPARYAEAGRALAPAARQYFAQNIVAKGMDALEAGHHVLEGIHGNKLYILSHPEFEPIVRQRLEAILASFPRAVAAPAERLRAEAVTLANPVYVRERDS